MSYRDDLKICFCYDASKMDPQQLLEFQQCFNEELYGLAVLALGKITLAISESEAERRKEELGILSTSDDMDTKLVLQEFVKGLDLPVREPREGPSRSFIRVALSSTLPNCYRIADSSCFV